MTDKKKKTLIALKKAKASIDHIIYMVEKDEYCINIMQQNLAIIGLLKSSYHNLMENHLKTCFKNAMNANNEKIKQEMIEEVIKVSKYATKFNL